MTHGHLRVIIGGEYFGLRKKLDSGRREGECMLAPLHVRARTKAATSDGNGG